MKKYLVSLLFIVFIAILLACGCGGSSEPSATATPTPIGETIVQAESGDTVRVHYNGRLEDGTEFDSSVGREPLQFTLGEGSMIPGFEKAVIGMSLGQWKTVEIPADEAYGPYREELVLVVDRGELPPDLEPEVGQQLQMRQTDGPVIPVTVIEVSESSVTLDANHRLAGKDLIFEIQLVEIL